MNTKIKSAYIHIPFCKHICTYCDFNKYYIDTQPVDEYIDQLIKEIKSVPKQSMQTVFIGGGTPTALSIEQLKRLFKAIYEQFDGIEELTVEANPEELTDDKIECLKAYGVNRLSIGVQTFDAELLNVLGRAHSKDQSIQSVYKAKDVGIESISLDLMSELPHQSLEQLKSSLEIALNLPIDHISIYGLILEPQTMMYNAYRKSKLELPKETTIDEMDEMIESMMEQVQMKRYETSNFATSEEHQSKHNLTYWNNDYYYGFGAGAHGYVDGVRYSNINPVNHYIESIKKHHHARRVEHQVTLKEQYEEFMFLGLRKTEGVSRTEFERRYGVTLESIYEAPLNQLIHHQMIEVNPLNGDDIYLTKKGKRHANEVLSHFIIDDQD